LLRSTITGLQIAYNHWKNAMIDDLRFSWIADDGILSYLAGKEQRADEIKQSWYEVQRLMSEVKRLKEEL